MSVPYYVYLRKSALAGLNGPKLAAACGISRADAERVVRSKVPQAVYLLHSAEAAERAVRTLKARRLEAFALTPDTLKNFQPLPVQRAVRDASGVSWWGKDFCLPPGTKIRMIVTGKIQGEWRSTSKPVVPVARRVRGRGRGRREVEVREQGDSLRIAPGRGEEAFCCLIAGVQTAAILFETEFEYETLLPRLAPTRSGNFRETARVAHSLHPGAVYDERLYRFPTVAKDVRIGSWAAEGRTDVSRSSQSGWTGRREISLACLIYLEAFGPGA